MAYCFPLPAPMPAPLSTMFGRGHVADTADGATPDA
jgi:hypothetical protein